MIPFSQSLQFSGLILVLDSDCANVNLTCKQMAYRLMQISLVQSRVQKGQVKRAAFCFGPISWWPLHSYITPGQLWAFPDTYWDTLLFW